MELKDAILSTLAELEENKIPQETLQVDKSQQIQPILSQEPQIEERLQPNFSNSNDEKQFLQNIQERLLVLFEGFQSPNNTKIEAKVDLTLNFLEYLLASIETRLDILESKEKR